MTEINKRTSEPGFTDWFSIRIPLFPNMSMTSSFEWAQSDNLDHFCFRLVDPFGTVMVSGTILWPFDKSFKIGKNGYMVDWRSEE